MRGRLNFLRTGFEVLRMKMDIVAMRTLEAVWGGKALHVLCAVLLGVFCALPLAHAADPLKPQFMFV